MEITKTTDKYNFYQEGADYILDLGKIKNGEDTTTELTITGLEDSNLFIAESTCGCTSSDRRLVDKNTQIIKIKYKQCDPSFSKVLVMKYKNVKIGIIKVKGTCN